MDPQDNVTIRRALTQLNMNVQNTLDLSINTQDVTTSSLPDLSTDLNEQVSNLAHKIEQLQIQLNAAHYEVEKLSLENSGLKRTNQELLRKNELYRKINSSPLKAVSPTGLKTITKAQTKNKITQKRHQNIQTAKEINVLDKITEGKRHKETQTTKDTNYLGAKTVERSNKDTQTPNDTNYLSKMNVEGRHKETQTTDAYKSAMTKEHKETQTIKDTNCMNVAAKAIKPIVTQATKKTEISVKDGKKYKTSQKISDFSEHGLEESIKHRKPKICIFSTNTQNKVLSNAENSLNSSELCHYLRPNCKIRELLTGINMKIVNFTMNDFCVIMFGDEDFRATQDYFGIISDIREVLLEVTHTNVIICLPIYKYGRLMNMYNWRVESFNNLLYLDVSTHEHAYILDSNEELAYDYTMFNKFSGHINDRGFRTIFESLNRYMDVLRDGLSQTGPKDNNKKELTSTCTQTDEAGLEFFREQ